MLKDQEPFHHAQEHTSFGLEASEQILSGNFASEVNKCIALMQNERAEQLRSLSFLAGILLSFGMAALYQLVFEVDAYNAGSKIFYALTIALTV